MQAFTRLLLGFDLQLSQFIPQPNRLKAQSPMVEPLMPDQDAIDLANFLVDMMKRRVAFMPVADTAGGDSDIATVTRNEGRNWTRRKH